MLNNIILCGRLTTDPELKITPNGKYVTAFSLAVERDFLVGGEKETDFINIVSWGKTAEFICKYFPKGKLMIANGRLQARKYTTNNGENRTIYEVVADRVYFAGDKAQAADGANYSTNNDDFTEIGSGEDTLPF